MIILDEVEFVSAIRDLLSTVQQVEKSIKRLWVFIEEGRVASDDRLDRIEKRLDELESK